MGWTTTTNTFTGREVLACDNCGAYPVRKHKCPYGYCMATALCENCWAKAKIGRKERHTSCKVAGIAYEQREAARERILQAGKELRVAALGHQEGNEPYRVKVIFNSVKGETAYWMSQDTYHKIPLGTPATREDFEKHGKIYPAKNTEIYDGENGYSDKLELEKIEAIA